VAVKRRWPLAACNFPLDAAADSGSTCQRWLGVKRIGEGVGSMGRMSMKAVQAAMLGVLLLVAGIAGAVAQGAGPPPDAARMAAAKELIIAQGGVEQGRRGLAITTENMIGQVRRSNPSEADNFASFLRAYMDPQGPRVTKFLEDVVEDMTRFYAANSSLEDLQAMTAFVTTPAGQTMQRLAPQVGGIMAPRFAAFQEQLKKDIGEAAKSGALGKKQP
jgi:hypothetical protein